MLPAERGVVIIPRLSFGESKFFSHCNFNALSWHSGREEGGALPTVYNFLARFRCVMAASSFNQKSVETFDFRVNSRRPAIVACCCCPFSRVFCCLFFFPFHCLFICSFCGLFCCSFSFPLSLFLSTFRQLPGCEKKTAEIIAKTNFEHKL